MILRIWGWAPAVALMGTVFYISSQPAPEIFRTQYIFSQDKFLHIAVYFTLAVLIARALRWDGQPWTRKMLWTAAGLSALYGASDEIHQWFVPERTSEFADWVADALGAALLVPLAKPMQALLATEERLLGRFLPPRGV